MDLESGITQQESVRDAHLLILSKQWEAGQLAVGGTMSLLMPLAVLVHLRVTLVEMNAVWGLPHPSRMTSCKRESSNLASLNSLC